MSVANLILNSTNIENYSLFLSCLGTDTFRTSSKDVLIESFSSYFFALSFGFSFLFIM